MKCQILFFSGKISRNISKCRLLKFLPNMQSVKRKPTIGVIGNWWTTASLKQQLNTIAFEMIFNPFPTILHVRQAMIKISMRTRAVGSESSLAA